MILSAFCGQLSHFTCSRVLSASFLGGAPCAPPFFPLRYLTCLLRLRNLKNSCLYSIFGRRTLCPPSSSFLTQRHCSQSLLDPRSLFLKRPCFRGATRAPPLSTSRSFSEAVLCAVPLSTFYAFSEAVTRALPLSPPKWRMLQLDMRKRAGQITMTSRSQATSQAWSSRPLRVSSSPVLRSASMVFSRTMRLLST